MKAVMHRRGAQAGASGRRRSCGCARLRQDVRRGIAERIHDGRVRREAYGPLGFIQPVRDRHRGSGFRPTRVESPSCRAGGRGSGRARAHRRETRSHTHRTKAQRAAGGWRLAAGGWRLAAGGWRLAAGGWRLAAGGWRLAAGLPISPCSSQATYLSLTSELYAATPYDGRVARRPPASAPRPRRTCARGGASPSRGT